MKLAGVIAALSATLVHASHGRRPASPLTPMITTDFPDPSIIRVGDTWYAFASQSAFQFKHIKVQLATSQDLNTWHLTGEDALKNLAPWVRDSDPQVWAPSVSQLGDGTFLMYYSAVTNTAGDKELHCVGTASSSFVEGPYNSNSDEPFSCPTEQGGAIDASAFQDSDGKQYALYKLDRNALGHGGSCGNTITPVVRTPIMIQEVQADGKTKIGEPKELIANSAIDGPLIEAPYMVRNGDGLYVLFFSSNCYMTDLYDVSYATSTSPTGGFVKSTKPLFVTGIRGMIGPGGASISADGELMVLHGYASKDQIGKIRSFYLTPISFQGAEVLN